MKGYYLYAPVDPESVGANTGIERKVRSQHKVFANHFDCELVILPAVEFKGTFSERIVRRLPFTAAWRKWKYNGEFDDADFLYIRAVDHDDAFVRYLRDIKKRNSDLLIIYEIPTYPYGEDDRFTLSNFMFLMKERLCRHRAAKYFDKIVTFYGQKEIWGVPCIDLINGYDFSAVELPMRKQTGRIELISVASTAPWHGYDRVFKGMKEYYGNGGQENIFFHVVGKVLPEHQKMVQEYRLEEHVCFYGKLFGEELKPVYAKGLLGIDILGGFRINYPISSSLKSREYGAYGLPLITSSPVDYLPADCPYQLVFPDNDTAIDMNKVISFYHQLYDGNECNSIAERIREFAFQKVDMEATMKPLISYIQEAKS